MRLLRLIALGRLTEGALLGDEPVYLKPCGRGVSLRVDGEWPLTPAQARLLQSYLGDRQ